MHAVLERARKAAGISGMKKNYPDDPKQRGCGYWAAYGGSISNELALIDEERLAMLRDGAEQAAQIVDLEHALNRLRHKKATVAVELIKEKEGWSPEKGRDVLDKIAG